LRSSEIAKATPHSCLIYCKRQRPYAPRKPRGERRAIVRRLCCEAADRAMQVHGGLGYSRHQPFEHIYRHHRRYRTTEGAEEIQMRRVAGYLFGFIRPDTLKGVTA